MQRQIRVIHRTPGRIRFKVSGAKGKRDFFRHVDRVATSVKGVRRVSTSPVNESVIVHYDKNDPGTEQRLKDAFHTECALLSIAVPEAGVMEELIYTVESGADYFAKRSRVAASLIDAVKLVNLELKRATNNMVDLRLVLPLIFVGYDLFFIDRKKSPLAWTMLLLGSFQTFVALNRPAAPVSAAPVSVQ